MEIFKNITYFLPKKFKWQHPFFWYSLFFFFILRIIWAYFFPMANDEVYYWEWSRVPQLSYIDAPPFVAWQAYLGHFFFENALGARFVLPFFHFISTLFILLSAEKFAKIQNKIFTNEIAYSAFFICQLAPVFNLEGFLLLPDNGLLFGLAGSLYCLIAAIEHQQRQQRNGLSLKIAGAFGLFLGIAGLSKYHALPIALGFFLATLCYRGVKKSIADIPFWFVATLVSILTVSPVFIWNFQNQFASFHFQSQHGFAGFSLNFKPFLKFLLGTVFYIFPWVFVAVFFYIFQHFKNRNWINSINNIVIFPFLLLFCIIVFSALGKQALPHWTMPGFFLLIPAFVIHWRPLTSKHFKQWKIYFKTSLIISIFIPSILCFDQFNQLLIKTYVRIKGNADDLFQAYAWRSLQNDLTKQAQIDIKTTNFTYDKVNCSNDNYILGTLKWYWTSQVAFHFQNQPKVYNFDFINSSFYLWRDKLYQLANCNVVIIGSRDHYDQELIMNVIDIYEQKEFKIYPYLGENLIYLKGKMKSEYVLKDIYTKLTQNIKY